MSSIARCMAMCQVLQGVCHLVSRTVPWLDHMVGGRLSRRYRPAFQRVQLLAPLVIRVEKIDRRCLLQVESVKVKLAIAGVERRPQAPGQIHGLNIKPGKDHRLLDDLPLWADYVALDCPPWLKCRDKLMGASPVLTW